MKKHIPIQLFLALIIMAIALGCASGPRVKETAETDAAAVITDIQVSDNAITVTAGKQFIYTLYKAGDPYKVTVDIPDMKIGSFSGRIVSDKAGITDITPQQIDSPKMMARLEITLQSPATVVPMYRDNTLTLAIKAAEPVAASSMNEAAEASKAADTAVVKVSADNPAPAKAVESGVAAEPVREQSTPVQRATEISGIELQKTDEGVKVLISGNGVLMPNVFPVDGRIVIDVPEVSMTGSVPVAVISPLKGIRAGKHKNKVRIVLDLKEKTKFDVAAVGNAIEIALKKSGMPSKTAAPPQRAAAAPPAIKEPVNGPSGDAVKETPREQTKEITSIPEAAQGEGKYKGRKISLDFQDAEIGPIFRLLADVNGYNLVLDPAVKGKITIKLMNVPWDQALDIILNTFNLGKSIEGNILWVAPAATFAKILDEKNKARETQEKAEELFQEVIRINYASASEIQAAINSGKLLSPRGTITPDGRMNTLIIKDTQKSIEKMKELVKIMDVAKPQVMIEAKIVSVSSDYSQTLGIRWGGNFSPPSFPNTLSGSFSVNTPTGAAGSTVTAPGGAAAFTIGHANTVKVDLSLQALESIGKSKTLSNPKLLTMDNEAATIQQGQTFFIPTVSQAGTQSQQQSATLSLNVTPKITPDGYVQLKVTASDNSLQPGTAGASAVVNTKSLTTQALVKNGETLVLGGIYQQTSTESSDAVPLLSKIPGLGWLFKTRSITGPSIQELLILITPTIVSQPSVL
ncbi:MAG: type IV pilus secretin PilQ [Nitrospiraceae bacterium]|nr:type IV pilus secretin PilQ [Nitrospiraceae bacterium]